MRGLLPPLLALLVAAGDPQPLSAASVGGRSLHDPAGYSLVWRQSGTEAVVLRPDVVYGVAGDRPAKLDLYLPPGPEPAGGWPVVLFASGVGDAGSDRPLRSWQIYRSWLRTMASRGYVAAMGESAREDPVESLDAQVAWLVDHAREFGADPARIGLWACSGNVAAALQLAMATPSGEKLRAAAILYGAGEPSRVRADLPLLLVIAGRDLPGLIAAERQLAARAVAAGAPWTVIEAPGLPHAFDALDRSPASLAAVRQVLAFFDAALQPGPPGPAERDEERAAREALAALFAQDFERAHEYYNELAEGEGGRDPEVWKNLAWARRGLGSGVGEFLALEQAVAVAPDDLALRRQFARRGAALGAWDRVAEGLASLAESPDAEELDLSLLGLARLQLGDAAGAVAPLERAVALGAEPATRYNLACALARTGHPDEALTALEGAVAAGFSDRGTLEADDDLASLRSDPRFAALAAKLAPPAP